MYKIKYRFNWSNEVRVATLHSRDELDTLLELVADVISIQKL